MFEIVPKPESGAQSVLLEVIIPAESCGGASSPDIDTPLLEHIQDMKDIIIFTILEHMIQETQLQMVYYMQKIKDGTVHIKRLWMEQV